MLSGLKLGHTGVSQHHQTRRLGYAYSTGCGSVTLAKGRLGKNMGAPGSAAGRTITITAMGTIANSQKRLAMAMVSEPLSRLGAIVLAMVMVQREREFASC